TAGVRLSVCRLILHTSMGNSCPCWPFGQKNSSSSNANKKSAGLTPVTRSKSTLELFMTNKERSLIQSSVAISVHTKLLLNPPFSNFSEFTEHIFLTGIGGITLDNLKQNSIKCLINVAEEIPE